MKILNLENVFNDLDSAVIDDIVARLCTYCVLLTICSTVMQNSAEFRHAPICRFAENEVIQLLIEMWSPDVI